MLWPGTLFGSALPNADLQVHGLDLQSGINLQARTTMRPRAGKVTLETIVVRHARDSVSRQFRRDREYVFLIRIPGDAEDVRVLESAAKALKAGGRLLLVLLFGKSRPVR